jgi:hypothetical protein
MDESIRQGAASYAYTSAKDHQKLSAFGVGFRFREAIDILFRPLTQNMTYEALESKLTNDLARIEHLDDPMNFKTKLRHHIILLQMMRAEYSEAALREKAAAVKADLQLRSRSGILIVLKRTPNLKVVTDPELGPKSKAHALISESGLISLESIEAIIPLSSADREALRELALGR